MELVEAYKLPTRVVSKTRFSLRSAEAALQCRCAFERVIPEHEFFQCPNYMPSSLLKLTKFSQAAVSQNAISVAMTVSGEMCTRDLRISEPNCEFNAVKFPRFRSSNICLAKACAMGDVSNHRKRRRT